MELRHLRYFVAVAEELHFGRAARRLNVSQPPLSMQIAALERELGLQLLQRNRRNVALTKAGEVFLKRARTILSSTDEAMDEARRVERGYEGKLVIGFMSAVMLVRLAELISTFHDLSPTSVIDLRQLRSDEQYMAVIRGEIDVGFVDMALGNLDIPVTDLNIELALHERLMLCVSPKHPLAGRSSVRFCELAQSSFITLARQSFPSFFDTILQLCQQSGFNPHIVQQVETMPVAITLATAGYGVAVVPQLSQRSLRPTDACFIPIEEETFVDIYLISRVADRSGLVERLRSICRQTDVQKQLTPRKQAERKAIDDAVDRGHGTGALRIEL